MASFGSFETGPEVFSGQTYAVYSARKHGDATTEYALKIFSIPRHGFDTESAEHLDPLIQDIERSCAGRIALQQQAAAASNFISPIFETGHDERGVWYVTRFYHRSVNKIISGRVALTYAALHHIIYSIAQGALDMKRTCGRGHGDIQPTNVQMSRSEKLVEAEVVLADPLPGDPVEEARYELSDLRAIGRILVQLVLRREMKEADSFLLVIPILGSPEWTRLFDKKSERWLSLSNQLLDPNLSLERFTLEQLVEELEELRPKPPVSRQTIYAIAAVGLVLAVVAVLAGMYFNKGSLLVTTDPPGAEIKIEIKGEYRSYGKTDGKSELKIPLPKGSYKVRAEYPELPEQTETLAVEGGKKRAHQFLFPFGRIEITSTPANATVELDGKQVGATPYTSPILKPGAYTYMLESSGYEPAKVSGVVTSNRQTETVTAKLKPLDPGQVVVELTSRPSGAKIFENGVYLDTTPFRKGLSAGNHTMAAQFEDWLPVTNEFRVAESSPPHNFDIPHGEARFEVKPDEAEIFINDKSIGRERRRILRPGPYTVRVEYSGYESVTNLITVTTNNPVRKDIALKPMLGFVAVTTDPPGAAIFEARAPQQELGRTQAGQPFRTNFPPGTYSFIARYDGLDSVSSKPVQVAMGANIPLLLTFAYGSARFDSDPPGADVVLAGKRVASTPYIYRQKPGRVAYTIEMADYDPVSGTSELTVGAPITVSTRLLPRFVELVLRSDPAGAQFYLGDTLLRGTNDTYMLRWGTHKIRAEYPGLDSTNNEFMVEKKGGSMKFEFHYATLNLTNAEPDAKLLYQKRLLTNFPARVYLKPDVRYDFELEYGSDFRTNVMPVLLRRGDVVNLSVTLPELRRTYTNSIGMALVRVRDGFYVGKFEVTEEEYSRVITTRPAQGKPKAPVVSISWAAAREFCEKLTTTDRDFLARQKLAGWRYALPSEDEWLRFAEPSEAILNASIFKALGGSDLAEIDPARKSAGVAGIYDLFGNAAEWCADSKNNPIIVGGSFDNLRPKTPAAITRLNVAPSDNVIQEGGRSIGFRCVLKPPPK